MGLLDISQPVTVRTAAFPGDVPFSCGWTATKREGSSVNVGWAKMSPHVGTHVDAPFHFDDDGPRIGDLDLEAFVGPCVVVDARGHGEIGPEILRGLDLARSPRVLFRTQQRSDPETFLRDFPTLALGTVEALGRAGVKLVGIDVPSYDAADSKTLPVHHALGRAGILNVENLALDEAEPGGYELLAQPVRWVDMDGAPLRALLRK